MADIKKHRFGMKVTMKDMVSRVSHGSDQELRCVTEQALFKGHAQLKCALGGEVYVCVVWPLWTDGDSMN